MPKHTFEKILRDRSISECIRPVVERVLQANNGNINEGIVEENSTTFSILESPSNSSSDEDTSNNLITHPINRHIGDTFDARVVENSVGQPTRHGGGHNVVPFPNIQWRTRCQSTHSGILIFIYLKFLILLVQILEGSTLLKQWSGVVQHDTAPHLMHMHVLDVLHF